MKPSPSLEASPFIDTWLSFDTPGIVRATTGKSELGQGIATALAQVVADGLGVDLSQVQMQAPWTGGPSEGFTAGSMSVPHSGSALAEVTARTRTLFAEAASAHLGGEPVTVHDGVFTNAHGECSYWELVGEIDLHVDVSQLPEAAFLPGHSVGTDFQRLDLADKILGKPRFIQDMRLPDQLFGRIVRPPHRGVTSVEVDADPILSRDGVRQVVVDGAFVGVVANSEIAAIEAAGALAKECTWIGISDLPATSSVNEFLLAAPHVDESLADGREINGFSARYSRPFIAHASIGTSTAIALFADDVLTIYSHTQGVYPLRADIARALGMDPARIHIEHVEGAGCYGHNPADDAAYDAALLALAVPGHPIHVSWSREDELGWGPLGPAMLVDITSETDSSGNITAWQWDGYGNGHSSRPSTLPSPSLLAYQFQAAGAPIPPSEDPAAVTGGGTGRNAVPGYDIANVRAVAHRLGEMPIRASALRSLGAHLNVFATESHMDDLARKHERDPLEYRLAHLADPRGRAVLEKVADMAQWGTPLDEDRGRGIGYARYKNAGAWCAVVAEVRTTDSIEVTKLYVCTDVGRVINPDGVRNQIEGGAVQATSWTLLEQVRMDGPEIISNTWEEYPILTFSAVPRVEVAIIDRPDEPWLGSGEASMGPTAAAIGNAVNDALGVRVRDLPITPEAIIAAMSD